MRAVDALRSYQREAGPKQAAIAERYLRWAKESAQSDHIFARYLKRLGDEGMAPGTVDLHRRTIQAFFRHLRMEPPRVRGWQYDPKDADRPALAPELIAHLIAAARSGQLTGRQTALLALSSTYGMRAEELARVRDADVDVPGERIYIRTAKGGKARWCWLPPEIGAVLPASWPDVTANAVEKTFANMWGAAVDAERPDRVAWHSIRRALVRDLVTAGTPESAVARYMRWANGGARGAERMVQWYANPSDQVGADGLTPARTEDAGRREYDAEVWERHPYLSYWRT